MKGDKIQLNDPELVEELLKGGGSALDIFTDFFSEGLGIGVYAIQG